MSWCLARTERRRGERRRRHSNWEILCYTFVMENNQKGFVVPIVIAIVVLLAVGGGAYIYVNKSSDSTNWLTYKNANKSYEFTYPKYAKVIESNDVVSDTTIQLTQGFDVTFDVQTSPDDGYLCLSNPYKSLMEISKKITVKEDKIQKNGDEYRHLSIEDTSTGTAIKEEERFYLVKNNICYMVIEQITDISKISSEVKSDLKKITSSLKIY